MNALQKNRGWFAAALFTGFVITFFLDLTGVDLHQWLGVAVGAAAIYHLVDHWEWVTAVTSRFARNTSRRARLYAIVDAALLAGFLVITASGLVISTWFDLPLANSGGWLAVHITAAIGTLLVLVIKIALHARWVGAVARSIIMPGSHDPLLLAGRRAFTRVMGVVGLGSILALSQSAQGLLKVKDSAASDASAAVQVNSNPSPATQPADSSTCQVRCNKNCAFPGRCRRYVDRNNNNRCDSGECV